MEQDRLDFLKRDFRQGFIQHLGYELHHMESGFVESRLTIRPEHLQQDGFIHAGVIATMADHTGGYAAYTIVDEAMRILTIEFKINFYKPAVPPLLICRSRVVNPGRTVIVSESEIFTLSDTTEKQVSKAVITLMAVPRSKLAPQ